MQIKVLTSDGFHFNPETGDNAGYFALEGRPEERQKGGHIKSVRLKIFTKTKM